MRGSNEREELDEEEEEKMTSFFKHNLNICTPKIK
jgi:hypothetical protein